MQNFKIGDKIVCIDDNKSSSILIKGDTYIVRDFLEEENIKYVKLENTQFQFYASRFSNIKEIRKQKLDKLNSL